MDYTGLLGKQYRVNRKLTDEERSNQLRRKVRQEVAAFHNLSVIRINSTYLECVDRWFVHRGSMTAICFFFIGIFLAAFVRTFFLESTPHLIPTKSELDAIIFAIPFLISTCALLVWMMNKDSFSWTHFPIRFNHRKRLVYVFRTDGTVLQARWDKIFFTLGRCERWSGRQNWDIRGHVLDKDGETVRATFALPGDSTQIEELRQYWEFFRRYMEEGPASTYRDVHWCHDIVTKRETYKDGLRSLFFRYNGYRFIGFPFYWGLILRAMAISLFPSILVASLGRWFAMRTSKIPVWPTEVEAQCAVDAYDPYRRDASLNPETIPKETIRNE